MIGLGSLLLVAVAFAFAWSMGAHYTGATMGMSYASHSIRAWPALIIMAILALLGATFASHNVEVNLGKNVISSTNVSIPFALTIVIVAFLLTTVLTYVKVPSSTIQILVFAVVGTGLADGLGINWNLIGSFVIVWALAPLLACAAGYMLTRLLDLFLPAGKIAKNTSNTVLGQDGATPNTTVPKFTQSRISKVIVIFGAAASFTMGANDVSNASGVFLMTNLFGVLLAGFIGGVGLSVGALTWGKPLLNRVAFDIVKLDLNMASAAQFAQALVVFVPVALFGYFTSMNQALVGAMAGAGFARGRQTVQFNTVKGILKGWALGPLSSLLLAYLIARAIAILASGTL